MILLQQISGNNADGMVQKWMLHTLWMAVEAGGLSFASYTHNHKTNTASIPHNLFRVDAHSLFVLSLGT
jgi:hypothetical protein